MKRVLLSVLLLTTPLLALAQWPSDPLQVRSITDSLTSRGGSRIYRGDGLVVVHGREQSVRSERLDRNGFDVPGGSSIIVNTSAEIVASAEDGEGGMFLLLDQDAHTDPDRRIRLQRLDSTGRPMLAGRGVPVGRGGWYYSLVADGRGGAYVAWLAEVSVPGNLRMQHISSSGRAMWDTSGLAPLGRSGAFLNPSLVTDGAGGAFLMVAHDSSYPYLQRIDSSGGLLLGAGGIPIGTAETIEAVSGMMVEDRSGGVIVSFISRLSAPLGVFAQRFDSSGQRVWTKDLAISTRGGILALPAMIADGEGGAIFALAQFRNSIYRSFSAHRISGGGEEIWDVGGVQIIDSTGSLIGTPVLLSDGSGGLITVWNDIRHQNVSEIDEIYAQRVAGGGRTVWATDGILVSGGAYKHGELTAIANGSGGAYISWGIFAPEGPTFETTLAVACIGSDGAFCSAASGVNQQGLPIKLEMSLW